MNKKNSTSNKTTTTTITASILAIAVVVAASGLSLVATAQAAEAQSLRERLGDAGERVSTSVVESLREIANRIGGSGGGGEIPGCGRSCG